MIIKWLLVPALVAAVLLSLRARASLRGQARRKLLAVFTVGFGVAAVLFPGIMQELADLVGVTRGTDLLLYGLALVIIYLVGSTSVRFREVESQLVTLARQVAIMEAQARYSAPLSAVSEKPAHQRPVQPHRGVQQEGARRQG